MGFHDNGNFNHDKDRHGLMGVVCWGFFSKFLFWVFGLLLYVGLLCVQIFVVLYVFLPWVLIGFGDNAKWVWWR